MTIPANFPNVRPLFVTDATVPMLLNDIIHSAAPEARSTVHEIGNSRSGRAIYGLTIGRGSSHVSITAGAHADEPAGPMAAVAFAQWLAQAPEARVMLNDHTFFICPNVNPDGVEANRVWFTDPLDPIGYFENVVREMPGDDVEFGYPTPAEIHDPPPSVRPENRAVARFLAPQAPYRFHASLHGMAFAEGAWFLIGREWAERALPLRENLKRHARVAELPLHDIERHGEKGFHRIEPGFCTTPTSTAMRKHFEAAGDLQSAELFRPSSMEFIQSLGGSPLVMVSEMPLFLIDAGNRSDPPESETAYTRLRAALPAAKAAAVTGNDTPLQELLREHNLRPLPFPDQIRMILTMLTEGIAFAG